ncbi:MAG TPA: PKD domain-containing protein [Candidatus Acidoferrales bacterium]|nr:PKD domain-containing protein [Candidatus Acidoferrales bacterium]
MARWKRLARLAQVIALVTLVLAVMCGAARAQSFSAPKNVSSNADFSFTPQIAVDSHGNIFMAWEDDTSTNSNILFSRSTDGGATFSTPKNLSNTAGSSFSPRIAVGSDGSVNVVWEDTTPGSGDIMFSRSADAGTTFSTPVNVSNDPADSANPQITSDSAGSLYVVWDSDSGNLGILFSRSTDGGATFSAPLQLSTNTQGSITPEFAVDTNGDVSVVWEDDNNGTSDISFCVSADHGATFSAPKSLSLNVANSVSPQIAIDSTGNFDTTWENDSSGSFNIYFSRSADKGATFSAPKNVSNGTGTAGSPQIATDAGGNINLVWSDNIPPAANSDIYFTRSKDGGATFSSPQNLSNNTGMSGNPWLTIDAGGNINVAWEDNTPGNQDIFYSRSTDSGATFSSPLNISNDSGMSIATQIAADKLGNINVTWQDATPGPSQIFFSSFASGATANQPPVANAGLDQTVPCAGSNGTTVTLDGSKSSDPDGDTLSFVWTNGANIVVGTAPQVTLTLTPGTYTFTLTVTDAGGLRSSAATHVTIGNSSAPTLGLTLSPRILWPPNHELVDVTATVNANDSCDASPAVSLVSITSSEPDQGLGDGDQPNDIQAIGGGPLSFGTDVHAFLLRAERSGMGPGRIYTVTYKVVDTAGNATQTSAQVLVPSSMGGTGSSNAGTNRLKRPRRR